ncbi:hypothetical protein C8Q76DRAFT_300118 [Earliella scabrosa]|nr:hypothetical protein C8Q76DRAFT_300118 [Earliella scabrosa]
MRLSILLIKVASDVLTIYPLLHSISSFFVQSYHCTTSSSTYTKFSKMRFIKVAVSAFALATVASAQDPIVVQVGAGGLKFEPQFITVTQPNTVVTFQFVAANHSVAQSTFATPCAPLANGFNSGFVPVGNGTGSWNLTVTDVTRPIWFYCPQQAREPFHCTAGMVGAINGNATGQDLNAFVSAAEAATTIVYPSTILSGVNAFATAAPLVTVSQPAPSNVTDSLSVVSGTSSSLSTATPAPSPVTTGAPINTDTLSSSGVAVITSAVSSNNTSPSNTGGDNNAGSAIQAGGFGTLLVVALGVTLL